MKEKNVSTRRKEEDSVDFGEWGKATTSNFNRKEEIIEEAFTLTSAGGLVLGGLTILTTLNPSKVIAGATGVP